MNYSTLLILSILAFTLPGCSPPPPADIPSRPVIPNANLISYQQMELIGFIHFTVNTFTDKEWGYGDESPSIFNPSELNAEQWAITAKEAGMKELILTAKHHDGFCLWPSKYTEHSVKNSPFREGKGDLVREFVDACRKHGLKVGLYLSPWDRNHADYGRPEYITYYRNQLRELLTEYGEVNEIWFDGANGGDGFYGGANEVRKIDRKTYYDWPTTMALAKELQPQVKIFSDAGPDIRWVGNEHGHAGPTFWSTIQSDSLVIGGSMMKYLNVGEPEGNKWIVGQCDVSIRPGWFYHKSQDSLVKSPEEVMDIYYKSVGRNGLLLLNLPPDKRGLIHENDVESLKGFKKILDKTFAKNLAQGAMAEASHTRMGHKKFAPSQVLDRSMATYWSVDDEVSAAKISLKLPKKTHINTLVLQEPIQFGQRIEAFEVDIKSGGDWKKVCKGTTIGHKRIVRFEGVDTEEVRVRINKSRGPIALAGLEMYGNGE